MCGWHRSVAIRALDFDDDLIVSGGEDQLIKVHRSLQCSLPSNNARSCVCVRAYVA
jgi:hypothetical protein